MTDTIAERIAREPTPQVEEKVFVPDSWPFEVVGAQFARRLEQERSYLLEFMERVMAAYRKETWCDNNPKGVAIATPLLEEYRAFLAHLQGPPKRGPLEREPTESNEGGLVK